MDVLAQSIIVVMTLLLVFYINSSTFKLQQNKCQQSEEKCVIKSAQSLSGKKQSSTRYHPQSKDFLPYHL
jgi:hypothetical protein